MSIKGHEAENIPPQESVAIGITPLISAVSFPSGCLPAMLPNPALGEARWSRKDGELAQRGHSQRHYLSRRETSTGGGLSGSLFMSLFPKTRG